MTVSGLKIRRVHFIDFLLITIFLLIPLLILVAFRHLPSESTDLLSTNLSGTHLAIFVCIWLSAAVLFSFRRERNQPVQAAQQPVVKQVVARNEKTARVFRGLGVCLLLLVVTLAAFYVPMRRYFWTGNDEMSAITGSTVWSTNGENGYSRPMLFWTAYLPLALSDNTVIGFLSFHLLLCYATAVLTYSIVRMLLPRSGGIALIAALLYIASPIEPTRFYVMWMSPYPFQEFLLLILIGLFARSYLRGWRWMLVFSGFLLIISALINEAILPATLLGPLLLVILWRKHRSIHRALVWCYLWFGVEAILGLRFVSFLVNPNRADAYQAQFVDRAHGIGGLIANLMMQASATFKYVVLNAEWSAYLSYGVFIGALIFCVLVILLPRSEQKLPFKLTLAGFGGGVLAMLLAVSAFAFEWHVWRTEFLALPFHAILWAFAIALIGSLLPRRWYRPWLIALPTLLITLSMSSLLAANEHSIYQWTPSAKPVPLYPAIQYDKTRSILQQIRHIAPAFTPGTVLVFYLDSSSPSTLPETSLGVGYYVRQLGNVTLGAMDTYQTNYTDFIGWTSELTPDGLSTLSNVRTVYPYNQLIIFRVSEAGEVSLAEKIPAEWLPDGVDIVDYNPTARIIDGQQTPIPFFQ